MVADAHVVVGPEGVLKERLSHVDVFHAVGVDGVHEVAVVHHDACRFFWESLVGSVDDVDEPCVGEVLDVVHDGGPAGVYLDGKLADVGCRGPFYSEEIEQLLELGQILQLDLLDEEDVHFEHHVHGFEQVLAEVAFLEEEGIESVVEVALEEVERVDASEDALGEFLVVAEDVQEAVGRQVVAGLEVEELSEGESSQVVAADESVEFGVLFLEAHDAASGEDDAQSWVLVVASPQFLGP